MNWNKVEIREAEIYVQSGCVLESEFPVGRQVGMRMLNNQLINTVVFVVKDLVME